MFIGWEDSLSDLLLLDSGTYMSQHWSSWMRYKNPQRWFSRDGTDGEVSSTSTSGLDFFFFLLKNNSRHNFEAVVQRLPSSSQEKWTFLTWNNFAHHLSQCWLGFSFSPSFSTFKCVCIHTHIQAPLCFTIRFGIFRCLLSSSWRDTLILSLPFVPTLFSG